MFEMNMNGTRYIGYKKETNAFLDTSDTGVAFVYSLYDATLYDTKSSFLKAKKKLISDYRERIEYYTLSKKLNMISASECDYYIREYNRYIDIVTSIEPVKVKYKHICRIEIVK